MPVGIITFPFYLGLNKIKNPTVNDMAKAMNDNLGPLLQYFHDSAYIRALGYSMYIPGVVIVRIGNQTYLFQAPNSSARGNPKPIRTLVIPRSFLGTFEFADISNRPANSGPETIEKPSDARAPVEEKIVPEDRIPKVQNPKGENPDQRIPMTPKVDGTKEWSEGDRAENVVDVNHLVVSVRRRLPSLNQTRNKKIDHLARISGTHLRALDWVSAETHTSASDCSGDALRMKTLRMLLLTNR